MENQGLNLKKSNVKQNWPGVGLRRALLIFVSEFADTKLEPLPQNKASMDDMRKNLESHYFQVEILQDNVPLQNKNQSRTTRENILNRIRENISDLLRIASNTSPRPAISFLLFLSTHGGYVHGMRSDRYYFLE